MRLWNLAPLLGALALPPAMPAGHASPPEAAPCSFGRGSPIPAGSTWTDQFKCYQASGRHVSVVGSRDFENGVISGGLCVIAVGPDRVQLAACGSMAGDSALTLAYQAIAYVVDDPRAEAVSIYVSALFHR